MRMKLIQALGWTSYLDICDITSIKRLDCLDALGMESYAISDAQISASSEHNFNHGARLARLHLKAVGSIKGAWTGASGDSNAWLQIDLIKQYIKITSVATQGRQDSSQWVTKYSLLYSNDSSNFVYYKEQGQSINKVRRTTWLARTFLLHIISVIFSRSQCI